MSTQKIINDVKAALKRGKPIPSGDVRALLAVCDVLTTLVATQQSEITALKAAMPKPEPEPEAPAWSHL